MKYLHIKIDFLRQILPTPTGTPMLEHMHATDVLTMVRSETADDRRHAAEETLGRRLRRIRRLARR
ncbi:MAG: hypothetical protein KY461_01920 [Actinobacteria bacterium]|nr:hypothetical protein [Actinomycetota bacterium]